MKSGILNNLVDALESLPEETKKKMTNFFKDKRPDGWNQLSSTNLPIVYENGSYIKMKHLTGSIDSVWVKGDPYTWWVIVGKSSGYTHWFK